MFKEQLKNIWYSEPLIRIRAGVSYKKSTNDRILHEELTKLSSPKKNEEPCNSIIREVEQYTGLSESTILRMVEDEKSIHRDWFSCPRTNSDSIETFYNSVSYFFSDLLATELRGHGFMGLRKMVGTLQVAKQLRGILGNTYLDYGSGIGSLSIMFGRSEFSVSVADISSYLLSFVKFRLSLRCIPFSSYYLKEADLPENTYSFVTVYDVLEHCYDPIKVMHNIWRSMKSGGICFCYVAFGLTRDNPTHIVPDNSCIPKIIDLGFKYRNDLRDLIMKNRTHFFVFEKK